MLEQHADAAGRALCAQLLRRLAQHLDLALGRLLQPQDLAQQHGLARARAADDGQHFAALHGEVQVLVHHEALSGAVNTVHSLRISTIGSPAAGKGRDDRFHGFQTPTSLNRTANSASTRITTVIEVTTDAVVPSPRLWVLGFDAQAEVAADQRDQHAEHHRLDGGQHQVVDVHRLAAARTGKRSA